MITPKYDGGAAFPCPPVDTRTHGWQHPSQVVADTGGMSLRDYFAGIALQAIITQRHGLVGATCADDAYAAADKMLAARNK